jgi:hypothetical protein
MHFWRAAIASRRKTQPLKKKLSKRIMMKGSFHTGTIIKFAGGTHKADLTKTKRSSLENTCFFNRNRT